MFTAEGVFVHWIVVYLGVIGFIAYSLWLWNKGWDSRDRN